MAAIPKRLSDTALDEAIRSWRRARRSYGYIRGYPTVNVLDPTWGVGTAQAVPDVSMTDADRVQRIVERMPPEIRTAFEAYHLAIVRGESCKEHGHKFRWTILAIPERTYFARVAAGRRIIAQWLDLSD